MPRQAHRWEVELTPEERRALERRRGLRARRLRASRRDQRPSRRLRHGHLPEADGEQHPGAADLARRRGETPREPERRSATAQAAKQRIDRSSRSGLDDDESSASCSTSSPRPTPRRPPSCKPRRAARRSPDRLEGRDARRAAERACRRTNPTPRSCSSPSSARRRSTSASASRTIGWDVHLFHGQLKPEAKDAAVEPSGSDRTQRSC